MTEYESLLAKVRRWQKALNELDHHFKTRRGSDKQSLADFRKLDDEWKAARKALREVE